MSTWAEIRENILTALDRPTTESPSSDIYRRIQSELKNVRDKLYNDRPPSSLIGVVGPIVYSSSYPYIPIGGSETIIDPDSDTSANLLVQDSFENEISSYWDESRVSFSNQFAVNQAYSLKQTIAADQAETAYVEKQDLLVDELYISWYEYFRQGFEFPSQKQELVYLHNIDETLGIKLVVAASNTDIEVQTTTSTSLGDFSAGATMPTGVWIKMGLYIKLNTVGSSDGVIKLTMDGVELINKTDAEVRSAEGLTISNLRIGGKWDNGGLAPTTISYRYFDLVRVFDTDPGDDISFITLSGFGAPLDHKPMSFSIDDYVWPFIPWVEWVTSKNSKIGDGRPSPCWTISPENRIYLSDSPSSDDLWSAEYSYFYYPDDIADSESPKIDARYHSLIELEVISKFPNLFSTDVQLEQYKAYLGLREGLRKDFRKDTGPTTRRKTWRVRALPSHRLRSPTNYTW